MLTIAHGFAFGLGWDIAGAIILGRGLLLSPALIMRRSVGDGRYFLPREAAAQVENRVDGVIGLGALVGGFVIQAGAYVAVTGGVAAESGQDGGAKGAVLAVVVGVAAIAGIFGVWRLLRWPLERRLIIALARDPLHLTPDYDVVDGEPRRPSARRLLLLGQEFGHRPNVAESPEDYARRVFRIADVESVDPLATSYMPARLA